MTPSLFRLRRASPVVALRIVAARAVTALAGAAGGVFALTAELPAQSARRASALELAAVERAISQLAAAVAPSGAMQDPVDSLLRVAQAALRRNDMRRAAALFESIRRQHPRSTAAENAGYWEAFARHRLGGQDNLARAQQALYWQGITHAAAATRADAEVLAARIMRDLAQGGDATAAQQLTERAQVIGAQQCPREDEDERLMVLDALLSMDAERAMPTLKSVLARRDACSAALRRKAVFLISRKRTPETEDILVDALRNDPDREVREQAVFFLGQVNTEKSTEALLELLRSSNDAGLLEKVVFSLAQQRSERAVTALRDLVRRTDASVEVRGNAIFWLGQRAASSDDAVRFLTELYPTLAEAELKERVLFSIAQRKSPTAQAFLRGIALDANAPTEVRANAIFHASRAGMTVADLREILKSPVATAIKEQVVFAIANNKSPESVDALFDIVKTETDRDLRRTAIFWLGQSKDPRVPAFLQDILNK